MPCLDVLVSVGGVLLIRDLIATLIFDTFYPRLGPNSLVNPNHRLAQLDTET